jgi:hypothetical protein
MQTAHHDRIRLGALGLGLSALLLTVFPSPGRSSG